MKTRKIGPISEKDMRKVGKLIKAWEKTGKEVNILIESLMILATSGERNRFRERYPYSSKGSNIDAIKEIIYTGSRDNRRWKGRLPIDAAYTILDFVQGLIKHGNQAKAKEILNALAVSALCTPIRAEDLDPINRAYLERLSSVFYGKKQMKLF